MTPYRKLALTMPLAALAAVGTWACTNIGGPDNSVAPLAPSSVSGGTVTVAGRPGGTAAYQLNLSHIECTASGRVEIHFVLLNVPTGTSVGNLTWYNAGSPQSPTVPPGPTTGNVIHFTVLVSSGFYDVTDAWVDVGGTIVHVHNPHEYAGQYNCSQVCNSFQLPTQYQGNLVCLSSPLGSPSAECGLFGLNPLGKDAGNGGAQQTATRSGALAIVKDGTVGCGGGQQAYRFYSNVQTGNILQQPNYPNGGGISHITYCACPSQ